MDWQDVPEPLRMTAGYLFSVYGSGPFNERHIIHKRLVLAMIRKMASIAPAQRKAALRRF